MLCLFYIFDLLIDFTFGLAYKFFVVAIFGVFSISLEANL